MAAVSVDNGERRPLLSPAGEDASNEHEETIPFAWGPLAAMMLMGFIKPVCFDIIFPFVNQMILDNEIVDSPEKVGFYSGIIESIFAVMNLVAIMPWTFASDRYGRKPTMLIGTIGMAASTGMFGLSKSYGMMLAMRSMGGIFAGIRSTMKVMLAETYPVKAHRISAFSAFQISVRLGQVVGQSLGGLLSHPDRHLSLFNTPFWKKYPYSLPGFVAFAIGTLTWAVGYVTLREVCTLPSKHSRDEDRKSKDDERAGLIYSDQPTSEDPAPTRSKVMTPHVLSILASTLFMTIITETFYALYPLYAFTPIASGGLGFSEAQIGTDMALRAVLIIIIIFFSAPIQRYLGPVRTYQMGMAFWPATIAFLPLINLISGSHEYGQGSWTFKMVFAVFFICWSVGTLVWPSSQLIIIESPSSPEVLATVTGIAQMVQSLGQAIAPAFATTLFAFSIESGVFGGNLTYVVLLTISCIGAVQCLGLKEPMHNATDGPAA